MKKYLQWRCLTNWHPKYYKYIDEWIENVTEEQMGYFVKERRHLIQNGIYNE
jgi:hypothetical protein